MKLHRQPADASHSLAGVGYALGAFCFWGILPIYFKAVGIVPATEMLAHRVFWSVVWVALLLFLLKQWPAVRAAFRDPQTFRGLLLSATLISVNWFVFIWAVVNDRVLEGSLGYYIVPLVSVLLGRIFLGERLWRTQWVAVLLAAVGVGVMLYGVGTLPWVALVLAGSFGAYGLVRKLVRVGAVPGLFIETLLVSPLALGYLTYLAMTGDGALGRVSIGFDVLLIFLGFITAVPLILYAQSVKRLRLASVGLFQYITPTIHMFVAVFLFGELFTGYHLVTFACIWTALAIYSASAWQARNVRPPSV